jgi:hypothetical protein
MDLFEGDQFKVDAEASHKISHLKIELATVIDPSKY